jgi:thiamine transporter
MIGCVLLDYIVAYAVMGTTCLFAKGFKHRSAGVAVGTAATGLLRYGCSFLSGILIWGGYAPEDMPVWMYSLTYNGSYMLPEIAVTVVSAVIILRILEKRRQPA